MKKLISFFIAGLLIFSPLSEAAWNDTLPGTTNISDIDARVTENYDALESLLGIYYHKNLRVTRTSASIVRVQADAVILQTSTLNVRVTSVDVSCNVTSSGANGLDSGAEASSTWYYIYVMQKSSDSTKGCLLSTSSSSPTMPSGYDQKSLVSAVRNNGSSDFINFYQYGNKYRYDEYQSVLNTSSPASSFTDIDCSAFIPPITQFAVFNARELNNNGASTTTTFYFRPNGSSSTGTVIFEMEDGHGSGGQGFGAYFDMPVDSSGIIEYQSETQQRGINIGVAGFELY